MLVDITLNITPQMVQDAQGNEKKALVGHLGTHFDIMNQEFPLAYTRRNGIVFDVSSVENREIDIADIDLCAIEADMFVGFYTGFLEKVGYGGKVYFTEHPQLSLALIDALLAKGISIIGIDFAGVRHGAEHPLADQRCAEKGVFIVENLCNLQAVIGKAIFHTYPMRYAERTGLPCRVLAEK